MKCLHMIFACRASVWAHLMEPVDLRMPTVEEVEAYPDDDINWSRTYDEAKIRAIQNRVWRAVTESDEMLSYFVAVLDGWNTTHYTFAGWIEEEYPRLWPAWQVYFDCGVLVLSDENGLLDLAPPTKRQLKDVSWVCGQGAYAGEPYLKGIFYAIDFAKATSGLAVVVTRVVDAVRHASQYADGFEPLR